MTKWLSVFLVAFSIQPGTAKATDLIQNVPSRKGLSLDGKWAYLIDPYETGYYNYRRDPYENTSSPEAGFYTNQKPAHKSERIEYEFSPYQTMHVPGDWNSQLKELLYYEGTVWYQRDFTLNKKSDKRYFIHFGAINYEAFVYVNGKRVGSHVGGFTAFNFEITDLVKDGDNFVVVKVDNTRKKEAIPTINTDWWNYGGITRSVTVIETEKTFIADYKLALVDLKTKKVEVSVQLNGPETAGKTVNVQIPELKLQTQLTTDAQGKAQTSLSIPKLQLWSPTSPKLYEVTLQMGEEQIADRIGFRTIATQGTDILLNGQPIYLKGICIHEENPLREARANGIADARMLLGWAKDLACNFVRLAHYPHNEEMTKLADELGLLVWSEIPVYWTIDWENKATFDNAQNQLKEMIARDKNRASIIIWSIGNETPINPARLTFMSQLAQTARKADNTRLISAALELHYDNNRPKTAILEDPLAEQLDIMSFNEYIGWYGNALQDISEFKIEFKYPKPVLISELGAGALAGYHGDSDTRWSEEFQAEFYRQQIKLLQNHAQIKGVTPWILTDFKSPKRLNPRFQDNWNRKGLISNNGTRKQAFNILKQYYQTK